MQHVSATRTERVSARGAPVRSAQPRGGDVAAGEELFLESGESCLEHLRFMWSERYTSLGRAVSGLLQLPGERGPSPPLHLKIGLFWAGWKKPPTGPSPYRRRVDGFLVNPFTASSCVRFDPQSTLWPIDGRRATDFRKIRLQMPLGRREPRYARPGESLLILVPAITAHVRWAGQPLTRARSSARPGSGALPAGSHRLQHSSAESECRAN